MVPAYRAEDHLRDVVERASKVVDLVIVVEDGCPQKCADVLSDSDPDSVIIIRRQVNGGVGAATKDGIIRALEVEGLRVVVKIDADGQIRPELVPDLIAPILKGNADFAKGNRFDSPEDLEQMPFTRLFGNSILSLINKFTSGYWRLADPTNGFVALSGNSARTIVWGKIANDYFFESDLLFRLRLINARPSQLRMQAVYQSEKSNLRPFKIIIPFLSKHLRNLAKRIVYMYYIRELNLGSFFLPFGLGLGVLSIAGFMTMGEASGSVGSSFTVTVLTSMLAIMSTQFSLQFLQVDMSSEPRSR